MGPAPDKRPETFATGWELVARLTGFSCDPLSPAGPVFRYSWPAGRHRRYRSCPMTISFALRELPLALKSNGEGSLQDAISDALRSAIQEGRLRPGARVPSSRDLARQLRVARGTVVLAYERSEEHTSELQSRVDL